MPKKKRRSTTSAARVAARVRKAQAEMRAAANRYNKAAAEAATPGPMFGPFIPQELLARRRADSVLARALRKKKGGSKKKRRAGKKKSSAAQRAARKRFAAAAKARSKAGKRRSSGGSKKRSSKRKVGQTVTAAQVIAMAKKGNLQRWLCSGPKRTGCGSTGRVVSGKGRFSRVR